MNDKSVKNTTELLAVIASVWRSALDAKADGEITKMEAMQMVLKNVVGIVTAFDGIAEIPGEIKDLHPEEMDILYKSVMDELCWPEHSTNRDVFNIFFNLLFHCVNSWRLLECTLNPPKAVVVEERYSLPDPP